MPALRDQLLQIQRNQLRRETERLAPRLLEPDEPPQLVPGRLARRVLRAAEGIESRFLEHGQESGA